MIKRIFNDFLKPLFDPAAWLMICLGSVLFAGRLPVAADHWANLPVLVTLLQIAGGIFIICGFALVNSRLFWTKLKYDSLMSMIRSGNLAAAYVLCGLKIFNGLSIIGFAIWLALGFNGGVR